MYPLGLKPGIGAEIENSAEIAQFGLADHSAASAAANLAKPDKARRLAVLQVQIDQHTEGLARSFAGQAKQLIR